MILAVVPIFVITLKEALTVTALKVTFLLEIRHVQISMNVFLINKE
jgi:hypothetical protein